MTSPQASYVDAPLNLEQRDELVLSHLTEVLFIARRIHERLPGGVPLEDLVHSGVLGLLQATQNFDSTRNIKFKTFAKFRIRGAILDSLRELDRASRGLRSKSRKLNAASEQLSLRLGRQPTEEEIAHEVGLEPAALRKLASTLRSLESRDQQVPSGEARTETRDLIESAPADSDKGPFAQCLRSEMRQHLAQARSNLSERENQILSLHYFEQVTMQRIAAILNLKQTKLSQIHSAALTKLRGLLKAKKTSVAIKQGVPCKRERTRAPSKMLVAG
jgi:RNA polymerase sigma factor for flagellar operon FliA